MRYLFLLLAVFLAGCGVKAPPIAPTRPPEDLRKLDCSPDNDPECDLVNPDYIPRKK